MKVYICTMKNTQMKKNNEGCLFKSKTHEIGLNWTNIWINLDDKTHGIGWGKRTYALQRLLQHKHGLNQQTRHQTKPYLEEMQAQDAGARLHAYVSGQHFNQAFLDSQTKCVIISKCMTTQHARNSSIKRTTYRRGLLCQRQHYFLSISASIGQYT